MQGLAPIFTSLLKVGARDCYATHIDGLIDGEGGAFDVREAPTYPTCLLKGSYGRYAVLAPPLLPSRLLRDQTFTSVTRQQLRLEPLVPVPSLCITMAHYDIFRHHLSIKFPACGFALWDPDPGNLYPAMEVGDVGYICEGKFHRLFNVLLPANHPSHRNFGVPEYHQQLTLNMENHINICNLSPNNFCSAKVTSMPVAEWMAEG